MLAGSDTSFGDIGDLTPPGLCCDCVIGLGLVPGGEGRAGPGVGTYCLVGRFALSPGRAGSSLRVVRPDCY